MNPMMLLQMLRNGSNPQQIAMNMLSQSMPQNPMVQNLLTLAQKGDSAQIETIARNMCASRGMDYDTEFKAFKNQMGFK